MAQDVLPTDFSPTSPHSTPIRIGALTASSVIGFGAIAGALGATLMTSPASATTFTVTTITEFGPGSLRNAIDDANNNPGVDTITFAGNVTGLIDLSLNLPDITEGVVIEGPGADALAISGGGLYHAFTIETNGTGGVVISGLTVTQSMGKVLGSGDVAGGALTAIDTPVRLADMRFVDNHAETSINDASGGAVYVKNAVGTGDVEILNTTFSENVSNSTFPGELATGGGAFVDADNIVVRNTIAVGNSSQFGGGLYLASKGIFELTASTVTGNTATFYGGGMTVGGHDVTVADSVITNNSCTMNVGGAYIGAYNNAGPSTLSVSNTSISNNSATELGGAIIFNLDGESRLDRVTITGNRGTELGGLTMLGSASIGSSTIAANVGAGVNFGYGFGPVSIASTLQPATPVYANASVTIAHSTITNNSREGITTNTNLGVGSLQTNSSGFSPATPPLPEISLGLVHVLAADNGLEDVAAPALSLFSLIERPNAGVVAGYGTQTGVDPQLQPLQQVSPTVSVIPILPGSPAWDGGYPGFTPPPAIDQRGLPRVVQIVDIGAYEVQEYFLRPRFTG